MLSLTLASCDIFDFIYGSDPNHPKISFSDAAFSSENRDGYERQEVRANMDVLGQTGGFAYLPSLGNPKILVLPISISGYEHNANAANLAQIKNAFTGESNIWESVESFYYRSSYGRLNLDITVSDYWYESNKTIEAIDRAGRKGTKTEGVQEVIAEALADYRSKKGTNGKEFDSNSDGYIDAVWAVYSCPDYQTDTSLRQYDPTCWAYTYYADRQANVSRPGFSTFAWASYTFAQEAYYADAHTFIHETGHMFGLEDYYDNNTVSATNGSAPAGMIDMMDANIIDHNSFSKFTLGWSNPFLIDKAGSITLKPYETSGEFLLLPTSGGWNGLPFDEYMMIEYYTPDNLNQRDSLIQYSNGLQGFKRPGIRIYHVDARIVEVKASSRGYTYTYTDTLNINDIFAHSNTGARAGKASRNFVSPEYRLLQIMDATYKRDFSQVYKYADDSTLFHAGDSWSISSYSSCFPNGRKSNDGNTFSLSLTVDSITSSGATISFN